MNAKVEKLLRMAAAAAISDGDNETGVRVLAIIRPDLFANIVRPSRNDQPSAGHVYYALADGLGRIKIGWSTNTHARIAQLQTASSVPLRLLATEEGPMSLERERHDQFRGLNIGGEWFALMEPLRAHIQNLSPGILQ